MVVLSKDARVSLLIFNLAPGQTSTIIVNQSQLNVQRFGEKVWINSRVRNPLILGMTNQGRFDKICNCNAYSYSHESRQKYGLDANDRFQNLWVAREDVDGSEVVSTHRS